jgi:hypothetical protein
MFIPSCSASTVSAITAGNPIRQVKDLTAYQTAQILSLAASLFWVVVFMLLQH